MIILRFIEILGIVVGVVCIVIGLTKLVKSVIKGWNK
jgi:hypothetical protein